MRHIAQSLFAAAVAAFGGQAAVSDDEEPAYSVVLADGPFEVRDYGAMVLAEVTVEGSSRAARSRAFYPLFEFITGRGRSGESIAMTAPVTQHAAAEEFAASGGVARPTGANAWTVAFIMPAGYTMETVPAPADARVNLRAQPPRRMAAVRFSGVANDAMLDQASQLLTAYLDAQALEAVGAPVFAFYDAPGVPGRLRRNEVMVEIRSTDG